MKDEDLRDLQAAGKRVRDAEALCQKQGGIVRGVAARGEDSTRDARTLVELQARLHMVRVERGSLMRRQSTRRLAS